MKQRILGLSIALMLTVATIMPATLSAADTTIVTGNVPGPSVTSVDIVSGMQGAHLSAVNIGGTAFDGVTSVSFGAGITVNSFQSLSSVDIRADITIASNATPGARDITVTTLDGPGTLASGFTVTEAPYITVTAPTGFSLNTMARGGYTTSLVQHGAVNTNAENWVITATGSESHGGFMYNGSASPTAPFQISKVGGDTWIDASGSLTYDPSDLTGQNFDFYARQNIDSDDPAGAYSITITFTGSIP
ncbi:MAG: hypothetical protein TUN42_05615 [Dehalogenimonas sp.]